jgi:hypothetical protein
MPDEVNRLGLVLRAVRVDIGNADAHAAEADLRNPLTTVSKPSLFHGLLSEGGG